MPGDVENVEIVEQDFTQEVPGSTTRAGEEADLALFDKEVKDVKPLREKHEEKVEEPKKEEEEVKEGEEKSEVLEELTEISGHARPSFKDLTTAYPDIFKKFPDLREIIGREHDFTEIFDSVDEAKEAIENSKDFTFFEERVMHGDARTFLNVIRDADKADLTTFVGNFLPALKELNVDLYMETTAPFMIDALTAAYNDGSRAGNENLKNSALYIAKYLFNDHRFATGEAKLPKKEVKPPEKNEEQEAFNREKAAFRKERFDTASADVEQRVMDKLTKELNESMPEGTSEYDARHIVQDVINDCTANLLANNLYMKDVARAWELAEKGNYDFSSKQRMINKIYNAYKQILPEIRRKVIHSATGKKEERKETRPEPTGGSRSSGSSTRNSGKQIDYSKTTDEQLFGGQVTYKS